MIGHIAKHGDRYYVVIHEGPHPATGKPHGSWHTAGASRSDAERLLVDLMSDRRKELVMAVLDARADDLDRAAEDIGRFFDHLREVGIRGFVADNTLDADYATLPPYRSDPASGTPDSTNRPLDQPTNGQPTDDQPTNVSDVSKEASACTEEAR